MLVIPAYREPAAVAQQLQTLGKANSGLLILLVLNQPDTDPDAGANAELRNAVANFAEITTVPACHGHLREIGSDNHLLTVERPGPLPASEGVGLARKLGCDIALALREAGSINSDWIHSSDADAILPGDYFQAEKSAGDAVAITFPFRHERARDPGQRLAMTLYELRLRYYVFGLEQAGSPYAHHSLGSCLAIRVDSYAQVRGFPRRAGGEDFYLLNKLAKLGSVYRANCEPITLQGRLSSRVPFGTGPALIELMRTRDLSNATLFYHPDGFAALGCLLAAVQNLQDVGRDFPGLLNIFEDQPQVVELLETLGLAKFLRHAAAHSKTPQAFRRHFHQWFDGFRTLKFIHGMREHGCPDLSLLESVSCPGNPWPRVEGGEYPPG